MKCPVQERVGKAGRCGSRRTADSSRGNGADDEGTRSDIEGGSRQAEVVGSGRDYGRDRSDDAALARPRVSSNLLIRDFLGVAIFLVSLNWQGCRLFRLKRSVS